MVVVPVVKSEQDSKKETLYFGRVAYRYTVGGHEYTSDLTDLGPGVKHAGQQAALADVSKYRPGEPVAVFYDPNDPSVAVVETGIPEVHKTLLTGLGVASLVSIPLSVLVVRSWLRVFGSSRAKPDAEPGVAQGTDHLSPWAG